MKYFDSLDSELVIDSKPVGVSFSSLEYSHSSFIENINNGTFSKTKIKSIIDTNADLYFSHDGFMDPKTGELFIKIWTNIKFLESVRDLLLESEKIRSLAEKKYIHDINMIVADYMVAFDIHDDNTEQIEDLHKDILSIVNAKYIVALSSQIPMSIAIYLSMAAFSTFLMQNNVALLNHLIEQYYTSCEEPLFDIQRVIYIYHTFFKNNFSDLFIAVMVDVVNAEGNGKLKEIKDIISMAILNILNSMDLIELHKVLVRYSEYLGLTGTTAVRFSLLKLPTEFSRIVKCAKEANENGFYIP